jgi:hypothetical protein
VEQFEAIRRDYAREELSIRALARRHGVHRRAVRQALADPVPPPKRPPSSRPAPKLRPYRTVIEDWLRADLQVPRKQRHTARRVWQRLVEEYGAEVSERQVDRYVAAVRRRIGEVEAFVPLVADAGVEAEVDWGRAQVILRSLGYELDAWHLGIIATGAKAERTLRDLRGRLGCEMLTDVHGGSVRAWLGGPRPVGSAELKRGLSRSKDADVSFALGEPGVGVEGWRLTHWQAREARGVAIYRPQRLTWYAEDRLLAAGLRNETLARSLRQRYVAPLRGQPDGGVALRKTLRAYIDAECSATSAESIAGVGRHAIAGRVRTAERLMGQSVRTCLPELDLALRLETLYEQHSRLSGASSQVDSNNSHYQPAGSS